METQFKRPLKRMNAENYVLGSEETEKLLKHVERKSEIVRIASVIASARG